MAVTYASSHPFPPAALVHEVQAVRQRGERGRKLILWGWLAAMAGVAGYCRALFMIGGDPETLDAVTRTGALGWVAAGLILGGIGLWLAGNLIYLRDAMEASSEERDTSR